MKWMEKGFQMQIRNVLHSFEFCPISNHLVYEAVAAITATSCLDFISTCLCI